MRPRCALPKFPYEKIWPRRWIAVVSTSPNIAMGGLHITLPMRADAQDRIIDYLHQDEVVDTEFAYVATPPIESAPLPLLSGDASLQKSSVTFGRDRDCISIPQGDAICMRKLP